MAKLKAKTLPLLFLVFLLSSCSFYAKTYHFSKSNIDNGMDQQEVIHLLGHPIAVKNVNLYQMWQYFEEQGKTYFWVYFQDGKVVQWGKND